MGTGTGPTESAEDFTASDILSPQLWTRKNPRPVLGLDVTCTKIAVDFQSMTESGADACIKQNLEALREATGTDAAFIALIDDELSYIESITVSKSMFAQCRPEVLKGEPRIKVRQEVRVSMADMRAMARRTFPKTPGEEP